MQGFTMQAICCGLFLLLSFTGCTWVGQSSHNTSLPSTDVFSRQGQMTFPSGAKFMVVPFTAGVGVEATQELEKVSLMIVRGIEETIEENPGTYQIVETDQAQNADFIIQGHVTELGDEGGGLVFWDKTYKKFLAVEALIKDPRTGRGVTNISTRKEVEDSRTGLLQLALQLGEEIGQELLERSN